MAIDPATALLNLGESVINKIWPDPGKRAEEMRLLQELAQRGELARLEANVKLMVAQMEVNKVEAASESLFKSGWRPFVGWSGACAFIYASILEPVIRQVALFQGYTGGFIEIDASITTNVLFGLLGIGAMRSYDKLRKPR